MDTSICFKIEFVLCVESMYLFQGENRFRFLFLSPRDSVFNDNEQCLPSSISLAVTPSFLD